MRACFVPTIQVGDSFPGKEIVLGADRSAARARRHLCKGACRRGLSRDKRIARSGARAGERAAFRALLREDDLREGRLVRRLSGRDVV